MNLADARELTRQIDLTKGVFQGADPSTVRTLSDLKGYFANPTAEEDALKQGDPPVYQVSSVDQWNGAGQLHYGLGVLNPGFVGDEYFFTKGHYHSWREAAEVYIGLSGEGLMLLEEEGGEGGELVPLRAHSIVYVPGHTAHRTINTGSEPLIYLGVYQSSAGHDYGSIAKENFRHVVIPGPDGQPVMRPRSEYVASIHGGSAQ